MASVTINPFTLTNLPAWIGDFLDREHMLAGGAKLVAAAFAVDAVIGTRYVPSGTPVGRTIAERDAGAGFGPADGADDEIYLTVFDVYDAAANNDVELYRWGSLVKENFLPNIATMDAGILDALRGNYHCTVGAD